MMEKQSYPAVEQAARYITEKIERSDWLPGNRLPSTRILASRAGVSTRTMIKAVIRLKKQGLIHGVERGSLWAGKSEDHPSSTRNTFNAGWQIKCAILEKDILSGVFAGQRMLPSLKELQVRYGACFSTMRKILGSLAEKGLVSLHGKTWELPEISPRQRHERVVFVPCLFQDRPYSALNNGQYNILDRFEEESHGKGFFMDLAKIDFFDAYQVRRAVAGRTITGPAAGFVFNITFESSQVHEAYTDFLNGLSRLKCPVAIIDESGTFSLPAQLVSNPLFQVFRIAGVSAGRDIARLLVSLGHHSAVYLSSAHSMAWSQIRYQGIQEIFAAAGWENDLHLVCIDPFQDVALLLIQELMLAGFDTSRIRKIFSVDRTDRQVDDLLERLQTEQQAGNLPPVAPKFKKRLQKNFLALMDLVKRNPDKDFFDRMCSGGLWAATNEVGAAQLEPLFEQALTHKEAAAWICASDSIAASAVRFLKARNIAVPEEISVAGFDNRPLESSGPRLSSFDFNARAFVHRSLNFIAHPSKPKAAYRHSAIEIEGIVMERETTGKAGRKLES